MQLESTLESQRFSPSFSIPVFSRSFGSWRLSVDRDPFSSDDLARHYDRKSTGWHRMISRHGFEASYRDLMDRVMRQSRYRQDAKELRVLDAGIGTGAMSSAFYRHIGRRFQLDGIDISTEMLRQAKLRLESLDIDLSVQCADLNKLPFPDNSFDVVLAAHVIEHLPDPQLALDEMFRVLKPEGILICSVTRSSLLGAYVQLIWRTHRVPSSMALAWIRRCGLKSVRMVPFARHSAARRFSLGYVGRKPSSI